MEFVCEKYKERMAAAGAVCRHPQEYCKFRTSCIIHFSASEDRQVKKDAAPEIPVLQFDKGDGLLPAIVQDSATGEILMLAYINDQAWRQTLATGKAHYWSRSRNKLWLKGETSKHYQLIREILVDCDEDTVVFRIEQQGGAACHTGHRSCFYRRVEERKLTEIDEPVFDPGEVYGK